MQVQDVMKKDMFTISGSATLRDAIDMLYKEQVSGLIVLGETGEMLGMLSEKDVYSTLYPSYEEFMKHPESFTNFQNQEHNIADKGELLVKEALDPDPMTTTPDTQLMQLGALMLARHVHRVPVKDEDGKLVGVITRGMLFRALFRKKLHLEK